MSHDEIEELVAAYALGDLGPDQRDQLEAHVRECPGCDERLVAFESMLEVHVVETHAALGDAGEPSVHVRASLMELIAVTPRADTAPAAPSASTPTLAAIPDPVSVAAIRGRRPQRARRSLGGWRWAAISAPVLAAACAALVVVSVVQHGRIADLHRSHVAGSAATMLDTADVTHLTTVGSLSTVHGQLVDAKGSGLLVLGDMPDPPANHVWHAWLEGPGHTMQSVEEIGQGAPMMYVPVGDLGSPMAAITRRPVAVVITLESPGATAPAGPTLARAAV